MIKIKYKSHCAVCGKDIGSGSCPEDGHSGIAEEEYENGKG